MSDGHGRYTIVERRARVCIAMYARDERESEAHEKIKRVKYTARGHPKRNSPHPHYLSNHISESRE